MLGWRLVEEEGDLSGEAGTIPVLASVDGLALAERLRPQGFACSERRALLVIGAEDPAERSLLLGRGYGDAVGQTTLAEIEGRALRIAAQAAMLPARRELGPLRLDLLRREVYVAGRAAGLHPREFALLWRLAEADGAPVAAPDLLGDVWRLSFRPETNSLAVHVSRLRAKLRQFGLGGVVETLPGGAYRLAMPESPAPPRLLHLDEELPLDAYLRLREECCEAEQDLGHAA
jgi:DNA-binding response OmpR family regulator